MQIAVPYGKAAERRFPEQITIAIAKDADGKHNPITISWTMFTSIEPPMLAISVNRQRHSAGALRHSREFVLSLVSSEMVKDAVFCGTKSGRDLDKLAECGTKTQPATKIDSVLLADAVANFECELESEHATGDHIIFVGRIVATHVHQDPGVRRLYTLGQERMGPVAW